MENKEMSQEKIESPDEKLIQHSESKKAMNGFQGSIVCAIILGTDINKPLFINTLRCF